MLVLSRKKDERVAVTLESMIRKLAKEVYDRSKRGESLADIQDDLIANGERLSIVCVELRGDKVRLGFEASRDWTIHRDEVQAAVDKEKTDVEHSSANLCEESR
jgi:sRNA-binding carbon storage regulator CsrA